MRARLAPNLRSELTLDAEREGLGSVLGRPGVLVLDVPEVLTHDFADDVAARVMSLTDDVKVVAFVGASADVFSLGMDLETFVRTQRGRGASELRLEHDARVAVTAIGRALVAIHQCARPTLGIARGRAVGGGVGLLAACDYVVASDDATFGLPEMLWGFVPAAIWPMITARIGAARARSWAMSAFARDAIEARAVGLVDELAPAQGLRAVVGQAVRQLSRVDRGAVGLLRRWSVEAPSLPIEEAVARGAELSAAQLSDPRVVRRLSAYFLDGVLPWEDPT